MKSLMKYIGVIKYILILFLLAFIVSLLSSGEISDADIKDVSKQVVKAYAQKDYPRRITGW